MKKTNEIIECNKNNKKAQRDRQTTNNKDTEKKTFEIIKCIKNNKILHKQNSIVQCNGQRKEHIATDKQNNTEQHTKRIIQYNRQIFFTNVAIQIMRES